MERSDVASELAQAQLQRTRLENDRLALELKAQRTARPWYQFPIQFVPLITALVSVAGFLWGVLQYAEQQQKNRVEREKQSRLETQIAERELMRPWLESQRTIYQEALTPRWQSSTAASRRIGRRRRTSSGSSTTGA